MAIATESTRSFRIPLAAGRAVWRHPLVLFLPIHAALLFYRLDLLPIWGDEDLALQRSAQPLAEMLVSLRENVHPPLYYVVAHHWLALPGLGSPIESLRALSALCALAAFLAVDRCWLRSLDLRSRRWFCALWTFSPCLLLYARMGRDYALQLLLGVLLLRAASQLIRTPRSPRVLVGYALHAALLLYVHYLPALAISAAVAMVLAWRLVRRRDRGLVAALVVPPLLVGIAYAPWLSALAHAIGRVSRTPPYQLVPNPLLNHAVNLGYAFVSFAFGEALPLPVLAAALLLAPCLLVLLGIALWGPPEWLAPVLLAAILGYAGTSRWVSFAFVPARLLFLYPFFLSLLAHGRSRTPRFGNAVCAGILCVSLAGIGAYFRQQGFLNKSYLIPFDAIAALIRERSHVGETRVVLDEYSTNAKSLLPRLPAGARGILLSSAEAARQVRDLAREPAGATLWFVRNTHDVSPGGLVSALEAELGQRYALERHFFVPYATVDRMVMRLAGWRERPDHMIEVIEMHRRARGEVD